MKRPRRDSVITVDNVARDLDTLNRRYTTLVNLLEERAKQLALLHPEDTSLQVSAMHIASIRSKSALIYRLTVSP